MTFHVAAGWSEDRYRVGLLQTQLLSELSELPHVQAAGMTNFLPAPGGSLRYSVRVSRPDRAECRWQHDGRRAARSPKAISEPFARRSWRDRRVPRSGWMTSRGM